LEAVLSATTNGILVVDSEGRIELFNPAAEMMFGHLAEDVRGMGVERLLPDLLRNGKPEPLVGGDPGELAHPRVQETRGLRRDGKEFPVRVWLRDLALNQESSLLIVAEDLAEQVRSTEHLVYLEQHDPLTGLLNRRELERQLEALCGHGATPGPHVLCDLDLDQFKLLNDTFGHKAGNELLKQLAILVTTRFDEPSTIARIGGDEIGILLPHSTIEEASEVCEDFRQTVRSFPFTWQDQSLDVAVSVGLVAFQPGSESPSSLFSKAYIACRMAKSLGRDRIHTYHDQDAALTRHHGDMRLVTTISEALNDGRFHLYAQPIAPLQPGAGDRRHYEVLVRMVDERGEPIDPERFIPAAERYILMPTVDRWIINRLFELHAKTLRAWHRKEPDQFLFAVNLSATSLADEAFLRYLRRQFSDWDVPYPSICFEITETAGIRNLDHARKLLDNLSALGCALALDDFGTGLSNYSYLRELPLDYVKIDGSFVRTMTKDPVNQALVESINQIGHVLGLRTIAEWAEDEATIARLRDLGVDFAQGYGIGDLIAICDLTLEDAPTSEPGEEL
jgi:diguanylate cyclase (GGDEF)-like protein/PAS domain S-box-containing protein